LFDHVLDYLQKNGSEVDLTLVGYASDWTRCYKFQALRAGIPVARCDHFWFVKAEITQYRQNDYLVAYQYN
jgi:hypothetical protein